MLLQLKAAELADGAHYLRAFAADTTSKLNILRHDSDTLGVDGAKVGILEQTNQVSLSSFLEGQNGGSLETKIGLEVLGNLTDKSLERELADEQVGGLLVATDLTESDGSRTVSVGLLDSSSGRGTLTSGLGGELLTRSLSSGGLACGLLGAGHFDLIWFGF
jgi:hypothetical protein